MGNTNRMTTSTMMNNVSSRSHAIFTIVLESESLRDDKTVYTSGKINLVDLAGSERMYKLANTKDMINEAKSINLSLHFLEQVIVTLREQASRQASHKHAAGAGGAAAFIPYRNSVLTSMLRDSLGGNCKSSFLMTVSTERHHFEESIATCRFGQRCGEVKVHIFANSEIGLSDQLKELTIRVRALERQLGSAEEHRRQLEHALESERMLRRTQTETRDLSPDEKNICKNCVQSLLSSARESLAVLNQPNAIYSEQYRDELGNVVYDNSQTLADVILERSQQQLYDIVESMDKSVLVELSTALGGLVQTMFLDRETLKANEEMQEKSRKQQEDERNAKIVNEAREVQMLRTGHIDSLDHLPETKTTMLKRGAVFAKYNWMGKKSIRHVCLSDDLQSISWRPIAGHKALLGETSSAPLSSFSRVEIGVGNNANSISYEHNHSNHALQVKEEQELCTVTLHGSHGHKSLQIIYSEHGTFEENRIGAIEWAECLRYLLSHSSRTQQT